jgi:hypothetical protein
MPKRQLKLLSNQALKGNPALYLPDITNLQNNSVHTRWEKRLLAVVKITHNGTLT